ncbi:MAG: chemotaxis protein CheD, partial [Xanthomonas sp.]|nr:chemotaxis protein CheD [Xanthomonas sp.]
MSAAAAAFADGRVMRYHDARFKTEAAKLLP